MKRVLAVRVGVLIVGMASVRGFAADGDPVAGDVKVKQTWTGVVQNSALKQMARQQAIVDKETLTRIWLGWKVAGDMPAVDFEKQMLLIVFADGPNRPGVGSVKLDGNGDVKIIAMQTEMAGPGFGYGLLLVDKAGIKSVEGNGILFPPASAPATQKADGAAGGNMTVAGRGGTADVAAAGAANDRIAAPKALTAEQYDGYFVNNNFEPNSERSVVVATTQKAFDAVFGAGFVMGDKSHRLAQGVFDKQLVVAVIRRGPAAAIYKLGEVTLSGGVLTVKYDSTFPKGPGGASYATPMILSVDKAGITSVKFVENGTEVGSMKVGG